MPTLVIAHRDDAFHPYAIAEQYAAAVPDARLTTVPSKDLDADGFRSGIREATCRFLDAAAKADRT